MTRGNITPLDEKLLLGVHAGPNADPKTGASRTPRRADATHRPGYSIFRLLLIFSLFLALFTLCPWSPLRSGQAWGMDAGGYVYLSVPLNSIEPQFEHTALRVDLIGAGVRLKFLEMRQDSGKVRFLPNKRGYRRWGEKRSSAEYLAWSRFRRTNSAPHLIEVQQQTNPSKSAKARYMALLNAYEREESRAERRALYPKLMAAYRRALAER